MDIGQLECSHPHPGKALEHTAVALMAGAAAPHPGLQSLKCDPFEVRCFFALILVINNLQ